MEGAAAEWKVSRTWERQKCSGRQVQSEWSAHSQACTSQTHLKHRGHPHGTTQTMHRAQGPYFCDASPGSRIAALMVMAGFPHRPITHRCSPRASSDNDGTERHISQLQQVDDAVARDRNVGSLALRAESRSIKRAWSPLRHPAARSFASFSRHSSQMSRQILHGWQTCQSVTSTCCHRR